MTVDPYAPCPGGTGKKVKFCCPDLVQELDKIQRMVAGDQRQACLEYIEQLEARFPDRACLLTTKALLLAGADRNDEAKQAIDAVLAKSPGNPIALAEAALLAVDRERDARAAIPLIQQALASCTTTVPAQVVEAIFSIAQVLAVSGEYLAARGHLLLLARWTPDDRATLTLLLRMQALRTAPLLFKEDVEFARAPADAPGKPEFDAALGPANRGAWAVAVDKLTALAARFPDSPAVWRNLAILRGWLADEAGAAAAYRRFSQLDVPLDDAVEAEAMAQLLAPSDPAQGIETIALTIEVKDPARAVELMLSSAQLERAFVDPRAWPDEPPPQQAFVLLDRPMPSADGELSAGDLPVILCDALYFGRETTREARVELRADRPNVDAAVAALREILGECLGDPAGEESIGSKSTEDFVLRQRIAAPPDLSEDKLGPLLAERKRLTALEVWPNAELDFLGGKSPRAAAADPAAKIPLLAAILRRELTDPTPQAGKDCRELRDRLGLPHPLPIDPTGQAADLIPLARLHRLEVEKLSDDDLATVYQRAVLAGAEQAIRCLAAQVVIRGSREGKFSRANALGMLSRLASNTQEALDLVTQARQAAVDEKESPAQWDLEELSLRIARRDADDVMRLVQHIERSYRNNPEVRQALFELLSETGLIPEQGPTAGATPPVVMQGAEAPEAGKLWTPESAAPAATGKSKLWTPGMD